MKKVVLAIGPHTDDIEIGCGATLSKWDDHIVMVHLSHKFNAPISRDPVDLTAEAYNAGEVLNVSDIRIYDFPVRRFDAHRQEILDLFISLKNELKPDVVLVPSSDDWHQDHQVATKEALRAFKESTILGYDINAMRIGHYFEEVAQAHVTTKIATVAKYVSQAPKPQMSKNYIEAKLLVNGRKIGVQYAESFEALRIVMK